MTDGGYLWDKFRIKIKGELKGVNNLKNARI